MRSVNVGPQVNPLNVTWRFSILWQELPGHYKTGFSPPEMMKKRNIYPPSRWLSNGPQNNFFCATWPCRVISKGILTRIVCFRFGKHRSFHKWYLPILPPDKLTDLTFRCGGNTFVDQFALEISISFPHLMFFPPWCPFGFGFPRLHPYLLRCNAGLVAVQRRLFLDLWLDGNDSFQHCQPFVLCIQWTVLAYLDAIGPNRPQSGPGDDSADLGVTMIHWYTSNIL